ncbi:MAG: purine-binding chemotaxis protein CheW [Leptospiraceae bacterium]|jgi:purine-binding chemotaxis protein CheW|nr:purine-binding chemotaxis protein CheW [Leptospiraceae bacterium]MBK7055393.1 purine-binding chemotaxis protein CheW [Leptospiraceae bacterium]MBK9502470.1 purine-binding chemotaxis protein CheW [Leptospiraceae bacterium]MBL0264544.1 purine-binding chemotaxis protein CheW [Leptospiraceae bacterium]MBP9165259.1 purine-binding chemotaxis protein CheW [Leptospiraceae bacterium]
MEQTEIIQSEEVIQFLSFSVSNEIFGIELVHVHEILRPVFITRIPNVEDYILGVVNLRGEIIPIVDLKKKFEQGFVEINKNTRIVVLENNGKRFGLVVEEVKQVIKIVKSSVSGINNHMSSSFNNMIDFVGRSGETIVLIVELKKLISFE